MVLTQKEKDLLVLYKEKIRVSFDRIKVYPYLGIYFNDLDKCFMTFRKDTSFPEIFILSNRTYNFCCYFETSQNFDSQFEVVISS